MGLWDYDFKIMFKNQVGNSYVRVPLATFAANYDQEGGVCVVFVEFLDARFDDSKSVIFGSMFFQSIYAQVTQGGVNAAQYTLYKNTNALSSTYIGESAYA